MLPAGGMLEQARRARDPRFDGRFFIGVRTTGVYCRPVCPVRMPRAENVVFFDSAAAATEAGYRPCLRCRPEASPGTPAWLGTCTTVTRALRLINGGALDEGGVESLSVRLGVTPRHLNRLFAKHLGASPKTVAQTRRLQFAKKLIDETTLPMTEVAMSAGYGSIRRFNDHFQRTYHKPPGELRKQGGSSTGEGLALRLTYREPYDITSLLDFFRVRATPGIEQVGESYTRSFVLDDMPGSLSVTGGDRKLVCMVEGGSARSLVKILHGVRRMLDVDAIPEEINSVLMRDKKLAKLVRRNPGLRLPGAFDQFEVAVRALVGQQISVKGATTVMGKIVTLYGEDTNHGRVFPAPARLVGLDPDSLPMPRKRAGAIRELARRVAAGELCFETPDEEEFHRLLTDIPGIGPWTAQYIALRAQGNPDAFLSGDLIIRRVADALFGIKTEKALLARADAWRPWRGYAAMHMWRHAAMLE